MRKQQQIWNEEHATGSDLPSETSHAADYSPSGGVVTFIEWLHKNNVTTGTLLDIGCGKGRNAVYAATQGFEVTAMDYIPSAVGFVQSAAKLQNIALHAVEAPMDEPWPFDENSFDVIIDNFASIDVETAQGREMVRKEMMRTLQPGGFAFVHVVSAEDELEAEMIQKSPADEPNSCYWPSGKFQKNYTEDELRETYAAFTIHKLESVSKQAHKRGRDYTATNIQMIIQKPE